MSPREDSPYSILGVTRDADDVAIKKAYRKLALQWHPDKHSEEEEKEKAEKTFKKIAHAYEILSDKQRRRELDRDEKGEPRRRTRYSHPDNLFRSPFDVFREFFNGHDPFNDLFFDDTFMFPSSYHSFHKHRHPASRIHVFYDDKKRSKDENECEFSTVIRFSSSPNGNAQSTKTTTQTKVVDGKKIVTKKVEDNEQETIEILENGQLKSRVVQPVNNAVTSTC